jgi:hypothetical protein
MAPVCGFAEPLSEVHYPCCNNAGVGLALHLLAVS